MNASFPDPESVANLVLTGSVWRNTDVSTTGPSTAPTGVVIQLTGFEQIVPFPFINALLPSMDINTRVDLGPSEWQYEGFEGRPPDQYDNNI